MDVSEALVFSTRTLEHLMKPATETGSVAIIGNGLMGQGHFAGNPSVLEDDCGVKSSSTCG
jgi:hypothetical protein